MPAGYSGTPLFRKLGYKEGFRALILNMPPGYHDLLKGLPGGITFDNSDFHGTYDLIHLFAASRTELLKYMPGIKDHLDKKGMIWISWPKRASSVKTDLNDMIVRETGLLTGLVDVKVCAVDEVWSGLKFVFRLKDRKK